MEITVREATWVDGDAVRDVHVASIEGLGTAAYDPEQVAAWARDREPADYPIDARETYFVVAESGADRREVPMVSGERAVEGRETRTCERLGMSERGAKRPVSSETADCSSGETSEPREQSDPRAVQSERLVGFASLNREPGEYFRDPVDGEVTSVYVLPDVVREGVGSGLYDELEGRARAEGFETLGLWASHNAVPFYEAHGFQRVTERVHEFDDGVEGTVVEMRKRLAP